jgi:hypothetical protein
MMILYSSIVLLGIYATDNEPLTLKIENSMGI